MKKDKLIQEFEGLKIDNALRIYGGTNDHPTVVENAPTFYKTHQNWGGINVTIDDRDEETQTWTDPDALPDTIHPQHHLA